MKSPTADEKRLILFDNPLLEKATVTSIDSFATIWAIALPLVAFSAWGTVSLIAALGLSLCGLLAWSLFEYFAHRHLFHWDPQWPFARRIVFAIHGNHHIQPTDHLRNLMPPIVSMPVGGLIWAMSYAVAGDIGTWLFFGFIVGYVAYDLVHYACHQWPMRGPIGKSVKRHHMRHHFAADHGNFGVTTPFWDKIFSTQITGGGRQASTAANLREYPVHPAE
ncbi:sterol desaturase family protein [Qipengyuania qiaonensis]|uniref:Sterol desaturase family protein n=1 Tax=Qipengyuania qiaonensis TaxID=2867240 RepID=A0ABS7J3T4_9SPHN|nr:sterol desaturase family protein [Qipengyuania qiaonensis]MBX7481991.1 sterol desaturase family protein [Qipengyuania qiaonensis]